MSNFYPKPLKGLKELRDLTMEWIENNIKEAVEKIENVV